jgi:hypothetical protein
MSTTVTIRPVPVPASFAKDVARDFVDALRDVCERIVVAGSLRRRKPYVKDVEILFVPKFGSVAPGAVQIRTDFFIAPAKPPPVNLAERVIAQLLEARLIAPRPNVNGVHSWGPENKLAIHVPSGMRVDLFTATPENFWNYLVCRTGGERNNIEIASAANRKGWKWNPYGSGFISLRRCFRFRWSAIPRAVGAIMIDVEKTLDVGTREMLKFRDHKIQLNIGLPDACVLVSQLQLALRHPENPARETVRLYCETIVAQVERLSKDLADFLRLGFDPKHDVKTR